MPPPARDTGVSEPSSSEDVFAVKPPKGTGVFLPRAAAGSRAPPRPTAHPGTPHHQQQQQSVPSPHPLAAQHAAAAASGFTPTYEQEPEDAFYPGGIGAGFADLADAFLGQSSGYGRDQLLYGLGGMPGGLNGSSPTGHSLTEAADLSGSWAQPPAGSYGNGSVGSLLASSMGAASSSWVNLKALDQQQQQQQQGRALQPLAGVAGSSYTNSSFMMQRGQWLASSPPPPPPPARKVSRRSSQPVLRQRSRSLNGYMQQLDTASDQLLGTSYQQQQMQQVRLTASVPCSLEIDAEVYLAGCYPASGDCISSPGAAAVSSSLGVAGQQQHAMRLQGSNESLLPLLLWPADEQLHSQMHGNSSSNSLALQQPLMASSSSSHDLLAVHAINSQLEQLLKLKEDVLAADASAQAARMPAAAQPLPTIVPMPAPAAMFLSASAAGSSPAVSSMFSFPEQPQHDGLQQLLSGSDGLQQLLSGSYLQTMLLGTSPGSAEQPTLSSLEMALGTPAGAQPGNTFDMPMHSRRSSNPGSARMDQRQMVGSWAEDRRTGGQLAVMEQALQKHAVRSVTEQKLQQLAAVQRMQQDLQHELLQMLH